MFKTTVAGLLARKLRVLTTSLAVLLGVAFMAGTLILTDTLGRTFDNLFADVNAGTDAYVRGQEEIESEAADSGRSRVDASVLAAVRAVDGVAVAEPSIQGYTQIVAKDGEVIGNPGQGAPTFGGNWTANDDLNPFTIVEGRAPRADNEVVIDKDSAETGKLAVGDTTTVLVKTGVEPVTIVGIAKFGELNSAAGSSSVGFTLATAERVITDAGSYDGIAVVADEGVSQTELRDRIAAALPGSAEAITGDELTAENQSDIRSELGFFNTFLVTFAAIALFVGSFIIYNTFSIIVAQRSRETALLRAIGASRRQVLGSILLEALVVGVIASVLGVIGGLGMAQLLRALLSGFGFGLPAGGLVLTSSTIITCLILGIGVSVASAVFPARRASKVPPIEAMRAVAIEASQSSRTRIVIGVAMTLLGAGLIGATLFGGSGVTVLGLGVPVTFLGVAVLGPVLAKPVTRFLGTPLPALKGMPGTLARNNAVRNPKRTSATAAALMIGVALVGFITVFAASAKATIDDAVDDNFGADLVLDSAAFGFGGLPTDLRDKVAALPEVQTAASVRVGMIEVQGETQDVMAIDPIGIPKLFDLGVTAGDLGDLGATQIAISEDYGRKQGLGLGDEVAVRFTQTGEQTFTVAAIYSNRELGGESAVSHEAWEANVADQFDFQVYVLTADGIPAATARAAVESVTAAYPTAKVQDLSEYKEAQAAQIDQLLGLIYALLGLAILIAVLGIANTLALSIFERTRELGLLRAVGMTRAQLRSTVRWESVLIALFGTGLGLVIGIAFGTSMVRALQDEGFGGVVIPVGQLAFIAALAGLCGILAAVLPARRASKLDVLAAIATA
ncbi:MAG: FtsX-like permease family protein [Actinomycetota bacterium]|nr:FtsX-like permease family protein [Actinomycetota bacterium]